MESPHVWQLDRIMRYTRSMRRSMPTNDNSPQSETAVRDSLVAPKDVQRSALRRLASQFILHPLKLVLQNSSVLFVFFVVIIFNLVTEN